MIIIEKNEKGLDEVEELWLELNEVHSIDSTYFKDYFEGKVYLMRKIDLIRSAKNGKMSVFLAYNENQTENEKPIGYAIANVTLEHTEDGQIICQQGELDSICVKKEYRGIGIGKKLMEKALFWLEGFAPKKMIISVVTGHEAVYHLYGNYGFFPRVSILQRKKKEIRKVKSDELNECVQVIRRGFATVANEFGLTEDNCATNGAFMKSERLQYDLEKGNLLYATYVDDVIVGFMQLEKVNETQFELEKLTILPEYRHFGLGKELLCYAVNIIKTLGGTKMSVGIIEENEVLKNWYQKNGFNHISTMKYDHLPFLVGFMERDICLSDS